MASTLQKLQQMIMIEKQSINGKNVWLRVESYHLERPNLNTIPTEYFTATYYLDEPGLENHKGETVFDEEGKAKLFESPVAALSFTRKKLGSVL